jgi:hypothetical protein
MERLVRKNPHLILATINSLPALLSKPDFFAVEPRLLLDRLADPDVPVQADDEVDSDRGEGVEVRFRADDQRGGHGHEEAVLELRVVGAREFSGLSSSAAEKAHGWRVGPHLAVPQRAGVQTHGAVTEKGLHFGDEEVPFLEKGPHLQLVRLKFPTLDGLFTKWKVLVREKSGVKGGEHKWLRGLAHLDAAGQVNRGQHEDCVLRGVRFHFPSFRTDLFKDVVRQRPVCLWEEE